jgi:meiotically up-regulated gene 157 (Mug157) protein
LQITPPNLFSCTESQLKTKGNPNCVFARKIPHIGQFLANQMHRKIENDQAIANSTNSSRTTYYFAGKAARGIGSPHTPDQYIWPISLCMQGLTATSRDEQLAVLEILISTDAGTGLMHESFHKDHPKQFTRPWFAWANSLFAEFVMKVAGV